MSVETNKDTIGDISTGPSSISVKWKIPEFFSRTLPYVIYSPYFRFLDGTWCLKMFPNGERQSLISVNRRHIGLYLMRKQSNTAIHCIWYRLKIQTKNGKKINSFSEKRDFEGDNSVWGKQKFVSRSLLISRKTELNPEGLVIVCDICTQMPEATERATQTESHKGADKLAENFKELFLSGQESDLTVSVRGHEFKCHRAVLVARSSVFATMLRQDMVEKSKGVVQIKDSEPEVFQQFLIYLYSGNVQDFKKENIFGLYQIADKYNVPEAKEKCVQLLTISLCAENFGDVADLCLQHNYSELSQLAVNFFARNTKSILVSLNWQEFIKKNPIGANELYLKSLDIK